MLGRYQAVTALDIRDAAAAVLRSDNRVILTYLPDLPPADTSVVDDHAAVDEEVAA
jgi:hypothetical protein